MATKVQFLGSKGARSEREVPEDIFGLEPNPHLLWEYVRMFLANQRQGTASAKTRARVRGGGRKPWRQKGLGRARAGSIRSPIWKGGGVIFGPHPRDFGYKIPKKARKLATRHALSDRAKANRIFVLKEIKMENGKTKEAVEILKSLEVYGKKVLILTKNKDERVFRAFRNIPDVQLYPSLNVNAYDVLNSDYVVFTQDGLKAYIEKEKKG